MTNKQFAILATVIFSLMSVSAGFYAASSNNAVLVGGSIDSGTASNASFGSSNCLALSGDGSYEIGFLEGSGACSPEGLGGGRASLVGSNKKVYIDEICWEWGQSPSSANWGCDFAVSGDSGATQSGDVLFVPETDGSEPAAGTVHCADVQTVFSPTTANKVVVQTRVGTNSHGSGTAVCDSQGLDHMFWINGHYVE
ncbi:MAG: hypothetical protein V3V47_03325 [Desulfobacteria bacterium]